MGVGACPVRCRLNEEFRVLVVLSLAVSRDRWLSRVGLGTDQRVGKGLSRSLEAMSEVCRKLPPLNNSGAHFSGPAAKFYVRFNDLVVSARTKNRTELRRSRQPLSSPKRCSWTGFAMPRKRPEHSSRTGQHRKRVEVENWGMVGGCDRSVASTECREKLESIVRVMKFAVGCSSLNL